jgi:hypothetical protein
MFDPGGDRAYMGSQFGAMTVSPSALGTSTSAFTLLAAPGTERGVVTGKVIGVSQNGGVAIFSDTVSTPNQVYIANVTSSTTTAPSSSSSSSSSSQTVTTSSTVPLNINNAISATFSPDGINAYILANGGTTLDIYSPLQNLLPPITLTTPATSIVFNSSGSFALLSGGAAPGTLTAFDNCDYSPITLPITGTGIPGPPLFLKMIPAGIVPTGASGIIPPLTTTGLDVFFGLDNTGIDVIATNTSTPALTTLCPQPITLATAFHINIGEGTFQPIDFFVSPDSTQVYIVASDRNGILVYDFDTGATTGIPLVNNPTPITAGMTADGTLIYVAATDGFLHVINTSLDFDRDQISFPPLVNSNNNFCYTANNCQMDLLAVRP